MLESVKDYAIFLLDPEGIILTWNSGAEAINGYAANEVLGATSACSSPPRTSSKASPRPS
jgi:PAS domain S-box-containing protein